MSSDMEEDLVGTQTTTVDENEVREEELDVQNFPVDEEEDDELCHITDEASQMMDIDVDELVSKLIFIISVLKQCTINYSLIIIFLTFLNRLKTCRTQDR